MRQSSDAPGVALALLLVPLPSACAAPEACRRLLDTRKPLSFGVVVDERKERPASWRAQLVERLRKEVGWEALQARAETATLEPLAAPLPPRLPSTPGIRLDLETLVSPADGQRFPVLFLSSRPPTPAGGLVILLHGHSASVWDSIDDGSELSAAGTALARAGFAVAVPEMRGFGTFKPGGRGHRRYVWRMEDGQYLREELADILAVRARLRARYPDASGLHVIGHSLGGFLALHYAALDMQVRRAVVSGIFVPYDCLNTNYHHACQHFEALAQWADMPDIAGLVAPRGLLVLFGERDRFFTPAVPAAAEKTRQIFRALSAPDAFRFLSDPRRGHELDATRARDFLLGAPPPER